MYNQKSGYSEKSGVIGILAVDHGISSGQISIVEVSHIAAFDRLQGLANPVEHGDVLYRIKFICQLLLQEFSYKK